MTRIAAGGRSIWSSGGPPSSGAPITSSTRPEIAAALARPCAAVWGRASVTPGCSAGIGSGAARDSERLVCSLYLIFRIIDAFERKLVRFVHCRVMFMKGEIFMIAVEFVRLVLEDVVSMSVFYAFAFSLPLRNRFSSV